MNPKLLLFLLLWSGLIHLWEAKAQQSSNQVLLEELGELTSTFYLFPEKGKALQKALLDKAQEWEKLAPKELADSVTSFLRTASQDLHFSLLYWEEEEAPAVVGLNSPSAPPQQDSPLLQQAGFQQVACLPSHIGYLQYTQFVHPKDSKKALAAAFDAVAATDALIIDVRENAGGDKDMLLLFCSYFYKKPTLLSTTYYTQEQWLEKSKTKAKVKGKKYLDKPVYILTSAHSFSAAEALAYHLQQSGRAIVVGDTTAGAANPAEMFVLNNNFLFFVPVGQEKSAFTGKNWEGIGVIPNLPTPAPAALLKAQISIIHHWLQGTIPKGLAPNYLKKQLAVLEEQLEENYNYDEDDF